jgi:hypothetical protein
MSTAESRDLEELDDTLDWAVIELVAADKAFHRGFGKKSVKATDAAWISREKAIADVAMAFTRATAAKWKRDAVKTPKAVAASDAKYRAQA